jgi:hypothetical protein
LENPEAFIFRGDEYGTHETVDTDTGNIGQELDLQASQWGMEPWLLSIFSFSCTLVSGAAYSSILKMGAAVSSETLVPISKLHSITSQKNVIFIFTTMRTSNLIWIKYAQDRVHR